MRERTGLDMTRELLIIVGHHLHSLKTVGSGLVFKHSDRRKGFLNPKLMPDKCYVSIFSRKAHIRAIERGKSPKSIWYHKHHIIDAMSRRRCVHKNAT